MNIRLLFVLKVLLAGSVAVAADDLDKSKSLEMKNGTLHVNWGPAPPLPDQGRPDFQALDSNGDGVLVVDETEPHALLHTDFIFADRNRDGRLSEREVSSWNR